MVFATHRRQRSIYIRSIDSDGQVATNLLTTKTRVAPIKTILIPRLELCAALLLSKLINGALKALNINSNGIDFRSDRTIVLSWLRTSPSNLKTFVANRVANI